MIFFILKHGFLKIWRTIMDITVEKVLDNISELAIQQKLDLLERIIRDLKNEYHKNEMDWRNLYGLGTGIWEEKDAQDYINELRENR